MTSRVFAFAHSSRVWRSVTDLMSTRLATPVANAFGDGVAEALASAIDDCRAALDAVEMRHVTQALRSRGIADMDCTAMIEEVGRPGSADRIADLRQAMSIGAPRAATLERCLLLHAVARYADLLSRPSMGESVLRCLADELRFLGAPSVRDSEKLLAPSDGFIAMAKLVTLRRFPAGQLHFEPSGIPLSWLVHLGPRRLTKLLLFLGRYVRGRRPFFFHHIAWRRKNRLLLLESEQNRSYFRIAQSLALHPEVKGLLTASWLHAPDTYRVSPHLAWLNRPFLEHGGLVVIIGSASESSGVFTAGSERRRLYDEGLFWPTEAMAIWPRAAMLDWASKHPELGD
jgi:hypothetical protein